MLQSEPEELIDAPRIAGYVIHERIRSGGTSTVYLAESDNESGFTALKVYDRAALKLLPTEWEALRKLRSDFIPRLIDSSISHDPPYVAYQYVDGETLSEWLIRPRPNKLKLTILKQAAEVLQSAHRQGVYHHDLTPNNLIIDDYNQTYLIDFGSAQLAFDPDSRPQDAQLFGTRGYVAPELFEGTRGYIPADIYSLGAVICFTFTGQPELTSETIDQVPYSVRSIIQKCMKQNPSDRYASAFAAAQDLERVLTRQPTEAENAGNLRTAWLWYRRHGLAFSLFLAVLGFLTLFAARYILETREAAILAHAQTTSKLILTADQAFARGQWLEAETNYRAALNRQAIEPNQIQLKIYQCQLRTNRLQESLAMLERHLADPAWTHHKGELSMIAGEWLLSDQRRISDAKLYLASSLASGVGDLLSRADRHYVQGLLATKPSEALQQFELALQAAPQHYAAQAALVVGLTLLGRMNDAQNASQVMRRNYPGDALPDFFNFYKALAEDQKENAKHHWGLMLTRLPSGSSELTLADADDFFEVMKLVRGIQQGTVTGKRVELFQSLLLFGKIERLKAKTGFQRALAIPSPCIAWWYDAAKRYEELARESIALQAGAEPFEPRRRELNRASAEARDWYPCAEFYYLEAGAHWMSATRAFFSNQLEVCLSELRAAAAAATLGAAAPTMFPGTNFSYLCRAEAAMADAMLLREEMQAIVPDKDGEREQHFWEQIRQLAQQPPSASIRTEVFQILLEILPIPTRLRFVTVWASLASNDPYAWQALTDAEWQANHPEQSLQAAARWAEVSKDNPALAEAAATRRAGLLRDLTIRHYAPLASVTGPAVLLSLPGVRSAVRANAEKSSR